MDLEDQWKVKTTELPYTLHSMCVP